jgi:hypothetical protein
MYLLCEEGGPFQFLVQFRRQLLEFSHDLGVPPVRWRHPHSSRVLRLLRGPG